MPKISIIVPVYKVEPYLRKCVDSVLAQTFTDFELILVDDGSPDNCPSICDEYAKIDNRVVVIHQNNGGLSAARNAGIDWSFANSDSEWITFIDSDDWVHPSYLESLIHAATTHNVEISVCGFLAIEGNATSESNSETESALYNSESFFVHKRVNAIVAWGKLYSKLCFNNIRFPVGKIHEDEYVTYRILFLYDSIAFIADPLYFYRKNHGSITNSDWSIKRLDGLEAQYQQILYFDKYGYIQALKYNTIVYFLGINGAIESIAKSDLPSKTSKKLINQLKKQKKLIYLFTKYRFPFKNNIYYYELATPTRVKYYWIVCGVVKKLKRNFGGK